MHFTNTILLLGASAATLANAATTSHYFTLSSLNSNTPSGQTSPSYDTITFPILDSATKVGTTCTVSWDWTGSPSTSYTACKNSAYMVKVSKYNDITDFTLDIKHEYNTSTGKLCVSSSAKTCVTTLATAKITKSGADMTSYCGSSGACGATAAKPLKFAVSSSTTGTK